MKDYIKEFNDYQSKKNISIKPEPPEEWEKELDVKVEPENLPQDPDNINKDSLKEFAVETVIKYMNESIGPEVYDLLEEQTTEIKEKVKLYESRPGFMCMAYHDDKEKNECILSARIDPTNNKDWVLTKEEVVYKLPYSYKDSLYKLFNEIRKKL